MKTNFLVIRLLQLLFSMCLLFNISKAQTSSDHTTKLVLQKDSVFWAAYNNCDIDKMMQFVTDEVEFYHDKNGVLTGKDNFRNAFQKNLCGNNNSRLRREPLNSSVKVF